MHLRAFVLGAAALVWTAGEPVARAQACCASTSTIFPARLQDEEDALLGLAVRGDVVSGSFDGQRVFRGQPDGASEVDLGQTLLVTARMFTQLQLNVSVPFVETFRSASSIHDAGGGVGDVAFALRWDMLRAGHDPVVPGIAPLLSITVPSGTSIDVAQNPLAADATGLGSAELGMGLALEQIFGRTLFALTGTASFHGARTVQGVHSQLGPDLAATLGVSYTFRGGVSIGGSLMYTGSFDSTVGDVDVPNSGRALTRVAVAASLPLQHDMRLLGSFFLVPPISSIGQNELATVGVSLTLIYGFVNPNAACNCPNGVCPPKS